MNLFASPTSTLMGDMFYLNPNVGNLSGVFSPVRLHACHCSFRFEGYKQKKPKPRFKYRCDNPTPNGDLKRVRISTDNNVCQRKFFDVSKNYL